MNSKTRAKKLESVQPKTSMSDSKMEEFLKLPYSSDEPGIRDALVAVVVSFFCGSDRKAGMITERQSLRLLTESHVDQLTSKHGMRFLSFSGIHAVVFASLAYGRVKISCDAYVNFFLPKFAEELRKETRSHSLSTNDIYAAIIYSCLKDTECGIKDRMARDTILVHRGMLAQRAGVMPERVTGKVKVRLNF
ncbi:unnamed protein product [Calicophoron daubneyi]|uniref:Nucleoprotein n=1 Tax=Calicophoron daubneyi TaxID=300641 RepID=A0AAV2TR62_CALDB